MITVTDLAQEKIQSQLIKRGKGLGIKIGVKTTGCSGLAYTLEFADKENQEDYKINLGCYYVYIDSNAVPYIKGMTVDYVKKGLNEGFDFQNPNEKDRCGCGESFRV